MIALRGLILAALIFSTSLDAQVAKTYHLGSYSSTSSLPSSNSANDILVKHDTIWFGTDKGLSETVNGGVNFTNFANTSGFSSNGISALAMNDGIIWAATASSFQQDNQSIPQGAGLYYSTDRGQTWTYVPQPVDSGLVDTIQYGINKIKALAITTTVNNITYDLAVTTSSVWSANYAGMLRRSTDRGRSWNRVVLPPDGGADSISPADSLDFDLSPSIGRAGLRQNLNHRVFSVYASNDTTIWVGTAGGINESTDGGVSWRKFSHQNQSQPISGNFVVAINEQHFGTKTILWAATVNAEGKDEERGVSYSDDGGATWKTTLLGEFAHNISFKDSIVYVATDNGLFRSSDSGNSWLLNGSVSDLNSLQRLVAREVYAVGAKGDTLWIAGPDGIAYTIDSNTSVFGSAWKIFRTYVPVTNKVKTYSYPLPFSPNHEVVRLHYGLQGRHAPVTIRIFDFSMHPVRILLRNAARPANEDQDEIWDGDDDNNRRVANGVYFYKIEIGDSESMWGKILVIQ
jgi:hypothetical protein